MKTLLHKLFAATAILAILPIFVVNIGAQKTAKKQKYNVLFLISDDLRPELGN